MALVLGNTFLYAGCVVGEIIAGIVRAHILEVKCKLPALKRFSKASFSYCFTIAAEWTRDHWSLLTTVDSFTAETSPNFSNYSVSNATPYSTVRFSKMASEDDVISCSREADLYLHKCFLSPSCLVLMQITSISKSFQKSPWIIITLINWIKLCCELSLLLHNLLPVIYGWMISCPPHILVTVSIPRIASELVSAISPKQIS